MIDCECQQKLNVLTTTIHTLYDIQKIILSLYSILNIRDNTE